MASLGRSGVGSRDGAHTPSSIDRPARAASCNSDDPASSSNSLSSRERSSLWGKLRKQAGRIHSSRSAQLDHYLPRSPRAGHSHGASAYYAASRTSLSTETTATAVASARPSLALPAGGGAHTLPRASKSPYHAEASFSQSRPSTASTTASGTVAPPQPSAIAAAQISAWFSGTSSPPISATLAAATTADAPLSAQEQLIQSVTGLERLKLIAQLGDGKKDRAAPAKVARTASVLSPPAVRASADAVRGAGASQSMDVARPVVDHTNPDDISAESIRLMLGAYTGKTEVPSKPRLRRLLPHSTRRELSSETLLLARIAEDDEQPTLLPDSQLSPERRGPAPGAPRLADASKRFSGNSGSTACSGDTLWAADGTGLPQSARGLPVPVTHRQAADWGMKLDPVVYHNTFLNARPASEQREQPPPPVRRRPRPRPEDSPPLPEDLPPLPEDSPPLPKESPPLPKDSPSLPKESPSPRLQHLPEPLPQPLAGDAAMQEIDRLRQMVRTLQLRNDMLSELVARDPMEAVPEEVRLHIRTIELENAWLRRELAKRPKPHPLDDPLPLP